MRRPHDLRPPVYFNDLQRFCLRIVGEKADVIFRMPVLGEINVQPLFEKLSGRLFNGINILVTSPGNGQAAGFQLGKISLQFNDNHTGIFIGNEFLAHLHTPSEYNQQPRL